MMMGVVEAAPNIPRPGRGSAQATPRLLTFPEFMAASMVARVLAKSLLGSGQSPEYCTTSGGIAGTVGVGEGVGVGVGVGVVVGVGVDVGVGVIVGLDEHAARTARMIVNIKTSKYLRLINEISLIIFPFPIWLSYPVIS
jgi:hypothetical protein